MQTKEVRSTTVFRPYVLARVRSTTLTIVALITANASGTLAQVADTRFNYKRGFYSSPFTVVIQSRTTGAKVRYTTDGSLPTETHGRGGENPIQIRIDRTTVLRALAYEEGQEPTNVDTHTYLFLEDVLRQPREVAGYPNPRFRSGIRDSVTLDYEMAPDVVDSPSNWSDIRSGLVSIPSLSLVLDRDELLRVGRNPDGSVDTARSGVYWSESGDGSTARVSAELLVPERPDLGFQVDAALEAHSWRLVKRAFKLKFQSEFGAGKLQSSIFRHAPLNGRSATTRFDRIVLRSGKNRSWASGWAPDRTAYIRDQWARDTQIAMSGFGAHGTFVHLYINGLYWGLYNPCERPDAWFASAYFGGHVDDWTAIKHDGLFQGEPTRWDYLRGPLKDKDLREGANYTEIGQFLDLPRFADYLALCWYIGLRDWPGNNWYATYRNHPPSTLTFFIWDAEESWTANQEPAAWVHPEFRRAARNDKPNMAGIWHALARNDDFLTLFADRVYQHTTDGGALSEAAALDRWQLLADTIEDAIVAESARWGDARSSLGERPRDRENTFHLEVERVKWTMRGNLDRFIEALRAEGYYPIVDPPRVQRLEGADGLEISNPNDTGVVHFTTNGVDPRLPGGGVFDGARIVEDRRWVLDEPRSTEIKARVKAGASWSALFQVR